MSITDEGGFISLEPYFSGDYVSPEELFGDTVTETFTG